jgi:ABC-2 type transport system ATP-binding protein
VIATGEMAVDVQGLTRAFGSFIAVDHISLKVRKGEIFGFLGPNGAGKSTTIRMLCGLLMPTDGGGMVGGYDIRTASESIKKIIGYMSQRFSLYDDLTVEENIDFFRGVYGVPKDRRDERKRWVLDMAGLGDKRRTLTGTLATGFKQRLALGCAVLHEPPVLFLDEPTSGVDPLSRRNFWNLIREMAESGTTIFVTTHYMEEADYCDRLALIYGGRINAEGTPGELREKYMTRDILEIETDRPIDAMEVLLGADIDTAIFGSTLHATTPDAASTAATVRRILDSSGIAVGRVEKVAPSLEDVFVALIEGS